MKPFILDCGNDQIKSTAIGGAINEDCFKHIIVQMTEGDWRRIMGRSGVSDEDYFVINGIPYVIGEKALRYGSFKRENGAARYTQEYYGLFLALAMARVFRRSVKQVFLMGSHPPGDSDYRDDLMAAACRQWRVEWRGEILTFDVVDANTFDEPLGGWANTVLRKDGQGYANVSVNNGTSIVLDIGAYTTDGLVIDRGGNVDYGRAESATVGVLDAVEQFKKDFRTNNKQLLKGVELDDMEVHKAVKTGQFDLRGLGVKDCSVEAREVRNLLIADVLKFYDSYGGAALYNTLILTGGGSALLEKELRERIRHNNIILANTDPNELHMANVRGGLKWYRMHELLGTWS